MIEITYLQYSKFWLSVNDIVEDFLVANTLLKAAYESL